MKNFINYTIGGLMVCTLIYVGYYSWSTKKAPEGKEAPQVAESSEIPEAPAVLTPPEATAPETKVTDDTILTVEQKLNLPKPEMTIDTSKKYSVLIQTSEGDITIQLNPKDAPITVNNFMYLAGLNFYDGLTFHRVIDGFMIQGGDPLGSGAGGPGYNFEDEISTNNKNIRGSISMANAGPNTNGSQFFINQVDNNFLDTKHTVFGNVTFGLEVVDKIAKMANSKPPIINTVKIIVE